MRPWGEFSNESVAGEWIVPNPKPVFIRLPSKTNQMANSMWWIPIFFLVLLVAPGCDKENRSPACLEFSENEPFTARIGETWCVDDGQLSFTFGPLLEDSRCNVPEYVCIWEGRVVLEVTIRSQQTVVDSFVTWVDWRDTLHGPGYSLILDKVRPETRPDFTWADTSAYRLDLLFLRP